MGFFELLLAHPWQSAIVLIALGITFRLIIGDPHHFFSLVQGLAKVFIDEVLLKSRAIRGALINILMLLLSFAIGLALVFHDTLKIFEVSEETTTFSAAILAIGIFLLISILSSIFLYSYDREASAFSDE